MIKRTTATARGQLEEKMKLPILNLCLAVLSRTPGDLEKATVAIVDAVENIIIDSSLSEMLSPQEESTANWSDGMK